jgi:hypothetical protein
MPDGRAHQVRRRSAIPGTPLRTSVSPSAWLRTSSTGSGHRSRPPPAATIRRKGNVCGNPAPGNQPMPLGTASHGFTNSRETGLLRSQARAAGSRGRELANHHRGSTCRGNCLGRIEQAVITRETPVPAPPQCCRRLLCPSLEPSLVRGALQDGRANCQLRSKNPQISGRKFPTPKTKS